MFQKHVKKQLNQIFYLLKNYNSSIVLKDKSLFENKLSIY